MPPRAGGASKPAASASSSSSIPTTAEELRSAHVHTLQKLAAVSKENAALQHQVEQLQAQTKGNPRMKQEELDSLYVEERRIIESLERQNAELKAAAAGARGTRDADVAKAQAESERLKALVDELRETTRKQAQLAAAQLAKIREAYQQELKDKADEAEVAKAQLAEAQLEAGMERSRADSLERRLMEAQRLADAAAAAAGSTSDDGANAALRAQLAAAAERAERAEATALESGRRATASDEAAAAARKAEAEARKALKEESERAQQSVAALADERKARKTADAAAKAELDRQRQEAHAVEAQLRGEIARLTSLLEEATAKATPAVPPRVATPPAPANDADKRSMFVDFVNLKREIGGLREENARLRRTLHGTPTRGAPPPDAAPAATALDAAPAPPSNASVVPLRRPQALLTASTSSGGGLGAGAGGAAAAPGLANKAATKALMGAGAGAAAGGGLAAAGGGAHSGSGLAGSLAVSRRSALGRGRD